MDRWFDVSDDELQLLINVLQGRKLSSSADRRDFRRASKSFGKAVEQALCNNGSELLSVLICIAENRRLEREIEQMKADAQAMAFEFSARMSRVKEKYGDEEI